jgi:hypothetical protein
MSKFKHGFPVSSAVMAGYLSINKQIEGEELYRFIISMILSEEGGQDINRMAIGLNANLKLAEQFTMPSKLDAPTVWWWHNEGLKIIIEAAKWIYDQITLQSQDLTGMGVKQRATFGFQSSIIENAIKNKIKRESELLNEIARKGIET